MSRSMDWWVDDDDDDKYYCNCCWHLSSYVGFGHRGQVIDRDGEDVDDYLNEGHPVGEEGPANEITIIIIVVVVIVVIIIIVIVIFVVVIIIIIINL